ncbi:ABC transporter ATP-binding protein [Pseudonocardia sp. HH130629-09]|uniref:ABC transporter ATP-binding protein n=1 Tax=Pseudonocardia sp. HH130629-09 TaxID=1641402 RepID=UPI0007617A58|nr:ABC transporter ATP-binding protein [Pseudonocardia sp. HH130629-09]
MTTPAPVRPPTATDDDVVGLSGVSRDFGAGPVVDDLDLSVRRGEFLALLGPSGCGKTTLLRMIAGYLEPTAGRVTINGTDATRMPVRRRNIGMVFQSYALFPHLSVAENVAFGLRMRKVGRVERDRRVHEALDLVGLAHLGGRRPAELSGGQQQRVALARAVVVRPDVLLLDEPLSNLDARLRVQLRDELARVQRETGLTTVLVTHDQEEALAVADRIVLLDRGRVAQEGTPREVFERPRTRFVAEFLGYRNVLDLPGRGRVAIRPEHVRVHPDGGAADAAPGDARDVVVLDGTMRSSTYRGTYSTATAVVPTDGGEAEVQGVTGMPEPAPGDRVRVELPVSAIVSLEADPEEVL